MAQLTRSAGKSQVPLPQVFRQSSGQSSTSRPLQVPSPQTAGQSAGQPICSEAPSHTAFPQMAQSEGQLAELSLFASQTLSPQKPPPTQSRLQLLASSPEPQKPSPQLPLVPQSSEQVTCDSLPWQRPSPQVVRFPQSSGQLLSSSEPAQKPSPQVPQSSRHRSGVSAPVH